MDVLKDRHFRLWDYKISHCLLLIRSPKNDDYNYHVDIVFAGVDYVHLPTTVGKILEIQEKRIEQTTVEFKLVCDTGTHTIHAATYTIDTSARFSYLESPLDYM